MSVSNRPVKPPLVRKLRRAASVTRDLIYVLADMLVSGLLARPFRQARIDGRGRSRLAIILVHGMGDLVIWRSALERIRELFPSDRFETTILCMESGLAFARAYLPADDYLPIDRQRFRTALIYREGIIREVSRRNFSVALQPSLNRYFLVEDALIRASHAERRIGSSGTPLFLRDYERRLSDRWYSQIVPASARAMHDLERNAEFLRGLGLAVLSLPLARLPPPAAREPSGYVLIGISSSSHLKTWPLARFEEVAHEIANRTGRRVVFCGDPVDADLRSRFACWREAVFIDRVGSTSLVEFVSLISAADLVLSNDSGTVHMALALRRSSIAVLGGGLVGRYHPYPATALGDDEDRAVLPVVVSEQLPCFDCGWHCRFSVPTGQPAPCIEGVTVGAVAEQAARALRAA